MAWFYSFLANVPISYSLKTPENQMFFGVFKGHKMGTLLKNGLNTLVTLLKVALLSLHPRICYRNW